MSLSRHPASPEKRRPPRIGLAALVERELELLLDRLAGLEDGMERGELLEEIRSLRALLARMDEHPGRRRKPPEAGLAVPAGSPRGPLPKQGGAAAAMDFGNA